MSDRFSQPRDAANHQHERSRIWLTRSSFHLNDQKIGYQSIGSRLYRVFSGVTVFDTRRLLKSARPALGGQAAEVITISSNVGYRTTQQLRPLVGKQTSRQGLERGGIHSRIPTQVSLKTCQLVGMELLYDTLSNIRFGVAVSRRVIGLVKTVG